MGILQFGWLAVNAGAVAGILCKCFGLGMAPNALETTVPGWPHGIIATVSIIVAAESAYHWGANGCSILNIKPTDYGKNGVLLDPAPADFNPRPSSNPGLPTTPGWPTN